MALTSKFLSKYLNNKTIIDRNELQNLILYSGVGDKKIGLNFCGFSFKDIDLSELDLSKSHFSGCLFIRAIIGYANFSECVFKNCKFFDNHIGGDFFESQFIDCDFENNTFHEADFNCAEFHSSNLDIKDLLESDFKKMPDLKKMNGLLLNYIDEEKELECKYTIGGFIFHDDDEDDELVDFDDEIDFDSSEGPR
jgi:uncharacterized protein YjbI with pentapeptide repeats